jgi:multisubunit Na+/H+ antiporter MnhB subunit
MTQDLSNLKRQLLVMMVTSSILAIIAVGFAVAEFIYGVKGAIWGFVGFLVVGFAVQIWFIRGFIRKNKGG